jgi:hypothetical protein
MNTVERLQYSLDFAFEILSQVTADLTQEQTDWTPPGTVNSIGSIYSHIVTYVDYALQNWCIEGKPQPESIESRPAVLRMKDVQMELAVLHEHAGRLRSTAKEWLSTLSPADLDRIIHTTIGELNLGQMVDVYIVWHINAHGGEIAALKGCQGAQGYPW